MTSTTRPLASLANLRDLGGHTTADGHRVRPGVVLRGEAPALGDLADALALHHELGIGEVVDLRHAAEVADRPLPPALAQDVTWHRMPFNTDVPPHLRRPDRDTVPTTGQHMGRFYAWMVEHNIEPLREVYQRIGAARAPLLVHCAVGKDRTGVTIALALLSLGVSREDVIADYHQSHPAMRTTLPRLDPRLGPDDAQDARFGAPVETITTFLSELDARHGSPEGFWHRLDDDGTLRDGLRARLLEPIEPIERQG